MEDKLKEIVNETVISPYSDDDIALLNSACQEVINSDDFGIDNIAENMICYLKETLNKELCDEIDSYMKDNNKSLFLKKSTQKVLSVFVNYLAINNKEIDETNKVLYSLAIMNTLLLAHGRFNYVTNVNLIAPLISAPIDFLKSKKFDSDDEYSIDLLGDIIKGPVEKSINSNILKHMAKDALYYNIEQKLSNVSLISEKDKFLTGAIIAILLVDLQPWPNINFPLTNILCEFKRARKKISINDIIKKFSDTNLFDAYIKDEKNEKDLNGSSILLRCLTGDRDSLDLCKDIKLDASEFFIYLYYELILEKALYDGRP